MWCISLESLQRPRLVPLIVNILHSMHIATHLFAGTRKDYVAQLSKDLYNTLFYHKNLEVNLEQSTQE